MSEKVHRRKGTKNITEEVKKQTFVFKWPPYIEKCFITGSISDSFKGKCNSKPVSKIWENIEELIKKNG